MAKPNTNSAADLPPEPAQSPAEVFFSSAKEAVGSAFLLWTLGGVAISIAGSFAGGMIPSLPPGFGPQEGSENRHGGSHDGWWHAVQGSSLALFFAIFFVHSLWVGFHGGEVRAGKRIERIFSHLRENWFGLIVGNAISAWVAVLVLGLAKNFSPVQMIWHWAAGMVQPGLREMGRFIFGEANWASFGGWFSWFDANQTKLEFWMIYLGGAFDDLGVPNFKTLVRWSWRRMQKRKRLDLPGAAQRQDAA